MARFSSLERLIASFLSKMPKLKLFLKELYIFFNYLIYRKNHKICLLTTDIDRITFVNSTNEIFETFFGYYDKSPSNERGWLVFYMSKILTYHLPNSICPLKIAIKNLKTNESKIISESLSYNWQQGARTQWLNNDLVIYNDFREGRYVAVVWSMKQDSEIRQFDMPIQDAYNTEYYLSINYRRIMNLRPDYGYRNLPLLSDKEMKDLQNDGIWKVDYQSGEGVLVHSLQKIIDCGYKPVFDKCLHKVNHVMINKTGTGFIFIHRFYRGKRRFDRLMYSDFKTLRVLADDGMVSHCCWVDNDTIFGYLKYKKKDGFYFYSFKDGFRLCKEVTDLNMGDGHPSCWKDWIVMDSYPDKSRMQHLMLYNRSTGNILPLLEVYHSLAYKNQTRCDLHPRFSEDGRLIFFDSVYTGRRTLCYVDVSKITQ